MAFLHWLKLIQAVFKDNFPGVFGAHLHQELKQPLVTCSWAKRAGTEGMEIFPLEQPESSDPGKRPC